MAEPRPPAKVTQSEILKAARTVERLRLKRTRLMVQLADVDERMRQAKRALRVIVQDLAGYPEPEPPAPLSDDEPLIP
jgi:hypothetical protein